MNWQEEFAKEFLSRPFEEGIIYASGDEIQSFISTQLEKLIDTSMRDADRVYINNGSMFTDGKNFKKTLKAKWLI